jgi:hypothetical protein
MPRFLFLIVLEVCSLAVFGARAQAPAAGQRPSVFSFPAYFDGGWKKTQFFAPDYRTGVGLWDGRFEIRLPPRDTLIWGPYVRVAGIAGSRDDAWQNEWIAKPGLGLQAFPFSAPRFRSADSRVGALLGPLRAFGEYNFVRYWGATNSWRPRQQVRAGFDYWKAVGVNDFSRAWWTEIWNGLYWQSSNEFTDRYDSVVFANSLRIGTRYPKHGAVSALSPYLVAQSSRTKYDYAGQTTDFYWENSFVGGGGLRISPSLPQPGPNSRGITRLVIYAEYLNTAAYYGPTAPPTVPRYDIHAGVSFSLANWYR